MVAAPQRGGRPATVTADRTGALERLRVDVSGSVQGVGFRPFVHRLAADLELGGWVRNGPQGVSIEVEGPRSGLERFLERLVAERPPLADIVELSSEPLAPVGEPRFEIRPSESRGERTARVLPDVATCAECLAEVRDPSDRRFGYPFTNCTHCGPRFSIVRALPYDRPRTTMSGFAMCAACRAEYGDPRDRRFHAQPNACPECGPRLSLWGRRGVESVRGAEALRRAARAVREGAILALKGIGGFQLVCGAADEGAVARLRERKRRPSKPLALMARDVEEARELCIVGEAEARALASAEAPIVLMPRRGGAAVAASVAPGHPTLGVMLAYSPLHHLLLAEVGGPVVATSGNLAGEPIATDEREAAERLGGVADLMLVHDRPIEYPVDDSVGWIVRGGFALLRRARGYAPLPVLLPRAAPPLLAAGGHLKSAVALGLGRQVFVSQHIGDLETIEAVRAFERSLADLVRLFEAAPIAIAHDLHPDYASTRWALHAAAGGEPALFPAGPPRAIAVQHHHAHLAACLADAGCAERALGVIWDGTGYGPDGTVWGGEFLLGDAAGCERIAHLLPFRLPGGEAAVREPRRVAVALLWELLGPAALERDDLPAVRSFTEAERAVLARMLERGVNAPVTTSAGRLFDGLAALLGLRLDAGYEGQAACALEFAANPAEGGAYPLPVREGPGARVLDWRPLVEAALADVLRGTDAGAIAARVHGGMIEAIAQVAREIGEPRVAPSGGCFQNRLLLERSAERLEAAGHRVLIHRQVPPNDGGICVGQAAVAAATLESARED
jgi:hydrogenase maturation protein HypF